MPSPCAGPRVAATSARRWVVETPGGGYAQLSLTTDAGSTWHDVSEQGGSGGAFLAFTTAGAAHWMGSRPGCGLGQLRRRRELAAPVPYR